MGTRRCTSTRSPKRGASGFRACTNKINYVANRRVGIHIQDRTCYGSSLLLEWGLINDVPKKGDAKLGYYLFRRRSKERCAGTTCLFSGRCLRTI